MEVVVTKQFEKDVDKELDKTLPLQLADIIEQIRTARTAANSAKNLQDTKQLTELN
jgi:mRNA-degrading endonuclease YafQ of YafQ-DinJ toxin-antitoxin module